MIYHCYDTAWSVSDVTTWKRVKGKADDSQGNSNKTISPIAINQGTSDERCRGSARGYYINPVVRWVFEWAGTV